MNKEQLLKELSEMKDVLITKYDVKELALFGSYSIGNYTSDSDVDLLVSSENRNYFKLLEMEQYISSKLQKNVDIGYFSGLKTYIRESVKKDLIYV